MVLAETRVGHVIMFLVGLFCGPAMPVLHMRGAHYPEIAASAGGFFLRLDTLGARRALGV
jgi:hypothetical protein